MKSILLFLFLSLLTILSCKEKTVNSQNALTPSFISKSSKCVTSNLSKGSALDSVFTYSFNQTLTIDFSAWANCCPDSGRFVLNQSVQNDTILVSVIDTAQSLCLCICPYIIHVEANDLPLDQYIVRCRIGDGNNFLDPIHLVAVSRNKL